MAVSPEAVQYAIDAYQSSAQFYSGIAVFAIVVALSLYSRRSAHKKRAICLSIAGGAIGSATLMAILSFVVILGR